MELAAEHERKQAAKAAWQDEAKQKVSLQAALQKEQAALQEVEQSTLLQAASQNVRAATALAKAQAVAKALSHHWPLVHLYTMTLKSVSVMKMRLASLVLQYCWTRGI